MAFESVDLSTYEPAGVDRQSFPLTVGLPFAPGDLSPDTELAVVDAAGKALPLQTRILERHDDASVRWLLLDYQADLPALEHATHALVAGRRSPEAPDGGAIRMTEQGDLLVVENGVLELQVDRARCRPLLRAWHRGELVSEGGLEFLVSAGAPQDFAAHNDVTARFEIEEYGPLRLLMRWEGTHRDDGEPDDPGRQGHFDFLVRMTVYAGARFVRVDHTFINRLDPDDTTVDRIVARLPLRLGSGLRHSFSATQGQVRALRTNGPGRLEQYSLIPYRIRDAREVIDEAPVGAQGWADVSGAGHGVMVAGKWFWQNYPKAIATFDDAISYELVPDRGQPFPVVRGMAKTHTICFCFHAGRAESMALRDIGFSMQRQPVPVAPSQHYLESGEFWDLFAYEPRKYPRLEGDLRELMQLDDGDHLGGDPTQGRAYGLKHYGDWILPGYGCEDGDPDSPKAMYLDNEYDTAHVCAMMFLHGGEVPNFYVGEAHALHAIDVDTCWHAVETHHEFPGIDDLRLMIGGQYRHSYQHTGRVGGHSHTFAEGLLDYYHLTGDRRFLDVAEGYAKQLSYMTNTYDDFKWGTGRAAGWSLLVMGGVYRARPDEQIRRAAQTLIDKIFAEHDADGNFMGGMRSTITAKTRSDRALNLCMRGLIKWHQVTGDPKLRDLMVKSMYGYARQGFSAEGLPLYGNWPEQRKSTSPSQGFANLETLAYAYRLTGDRLFIEAGLGRVVQAIQWMHAPSQQGDCFHRMLRGPFPFLAAAHELGVLENIPEAAGWMIGEAASHR